MLKKLFAPGNDSILTSAGLLALRLWLGATMLLNHGVSKLTGFGKMAEGFADPLGVGPAVSLGLVVFAEVGASVLLILGLLTRFGALVLAINMFVAFFVAHKGALTGEHSGELAFIYLAGYVTLLLAGAGKASVDKLLFGK